MNIYAVFLFMNKSEKHAKNKSGREIFRKICFLNGERAMPENYARENTTRGNNKNCNCKNKNKSEANDVRTPMSKQSAAQRKTQDCDR